MFVYDCDETFSTMVDPAVFADWLIEDAEDDDDKRYWKQRQKDAVKSSKIWRDQLRSAGGPISDLNACPYCSSDLTMARAEKEPKPVRGLWERDDEGEQATVAICFTCGWHRAQDVKLWDIFFPLVTEHCAVMKKLGASLDDAPLVELGKYIARNWDDRSEVSPGKAEELVADLFREHLDGEIHYTTNGVYTPDGGIDFVIVETQSGIEHAFQVKRRLNKKNESIVPVREFLGAMPTAEVCREHGLSQGTFYKFKAKYGGMHCATGYREAMSREWKCQMRRSCALSRTRMPS